MGVVYQVKDTIFWKQITTTYRLYLLVCSLFIKSKIQFFESKSQLTQFAAFENTGCLSSQRYNFLKANHNVCLQCDIRGRVVYQVKDTIFWKQITTSGDDSWYCSTLFIKSKIQFFESKSQRRVGYVILLISCLSSQRYNFLKANHNRRLPSGCCFFVVYQVKDTIFWKQITTIMLNF